MAQILQLYQQVVVLNPKHKYRPCLVISKYLSRKCKIAIFTEDFPECAFIAVTTYKNSAIRLLKVDGNPFAQVFQDRDTE